MGNRQGDHSQGNGDGPRFGQFTGEDASARSSAPSRWRKLSAKELVAVVAVFAAILLILVAFSLMGWLDLWVSLLILVVALVPLGVSFWRLIRTPRSEDAGESDPVMRRNF